MLDACCAQAAGAAVATAHAVNRQILRAVRNREVIAVKDASSRYSRGSNCFTLQLRQSTYALDNCQAESE